MLANKTVLAKHWKLIGFCYPKLLCIFTFPFWLLLQNILCLFFSPCLSFIEILYFKASFIFFSLPYHHLRLYDFYYDDNSQVYFLNLDFIFIHCFLTHYLGCPFNCQNSAFKIWAFLIFPPVFHFLLPWSTHTNRQPFGWHLDSLHWGDYYPLVLLQPP